MTGIECQVAYMGVYDLSDLCQGEDCMIHTNPKLNVTYLLTLIGLSLGFGLANLPLHIN